MIQQSEERFRAVSGMDGAVLGGLLVSGLWGAVFAGSVCYFCLLGGGKGLGGGGEEGGGLVCCEV